MSSYWVKEWVVVCFWCIIGRMGFWWVGADESRPDSREFFLLIKLDAFLSPLSGSNVSNPPTGYNPLLYFPLTPSILSEAITETLEGCDDLFFS